MNKGQVIWGIILLVLAAGFAAVIIALPPEDVMFDIGFGNTPWLAVGIMAVIGVILLASGVRGPGEKEAKVTEEQLAEHFTDPEKIKLNKRLENIGWGAFLVMLGCRLLVPQLVPGNPIPDGVWTVGLGVIWLGLNLTRYNKGIRMSGFTTFLGVFFVVIGIAELLGLDVGWPAFLIILGIGMLLRPWFDEREMFGKVEES